MVRTERIRIANFKCWESVELETKPFTVLIGPNGSGKSSVLQALILLKRFITMPSALSPDTLGDFTYADYFNLGRFEELVHKHEVTRDMRIGIDVRNDKYVTSYSVVFRRDKCRSFLTSNEPKINLVSDEFPLPYQRNVTSSHVVSIEGRTYSITWDGISVSTSTITPTLPPKEVISLLKAHEELLEGIYLIHPRHFFRVWAYSYLSSIDYSKLFIADNELTNILVVNSDVEEKVSYWCKELLGIEVASKAAPHISPHALKVEARWKKLRIPLTLEGAGFNRLVYILTSLAVPETKLLLVEEPEVHIHPRVMFNLGNLLPRILKEEGKQMLATTHNEHLLIGVLTGIAEGSVDRDDVAIYYFERDGLAAKARKLEVNEKGQVEGGLPGFFEVVWEATEAYLKALAKGPA